MPAADATREPPTWRAAAAELVGTFCLVFTGLDG